MREGIHLLPAARGLSVPFSQDLESLRATASRLATLVDSVQAGALVEDEACRVILVNQAFCEMFGMPGGPDELVGWETRTILGWTNELFVESEAFFPRIETLVTERRRVLSEELELVDGRTFERDYLPVFTGGDYQGHFWVFRDITSHKRTQEELRRTAERYRDFVENGVALAWSHALDGTMKTANRALARVFGAGSPDEVLGLGIQDFIDPRFRDGWEDYLRELEEKGEARGFVTVLGLDRRRRVLAYNNVLRRDQDGQPEVQGFGDDVTDHIRAQQELEATNRELEAANRALATANRILEGTNRRMDLLNELGDLLQTAESRDEGVGVLGSVLPRIFDSFAGAVYLGDADPGSLNAVVSWGSPPPLEGSLEVTDCWALRRGRPHPADPAGRGPLCPHAEAGGARGTLCIPMMAHGGTLGLLHLRQSEGAAGGAEGDLVAIRHLAFNTAEQLALGLVNLELRERLREQALRDSLTGLYNRRHLEDRLGEELRRAYRAGGPLAILLLDLDRFKGINDAHGHAAGDQILTRFAALLQETVRAEDVVARYGGEEFTVILPGADTAAAVRVAETLRRRTRRLVVEVREERVRGITCSVGVASYPVCGDTAEELMAAADAALYRAKDEGRDRVVTAGVHEGSGRDAGEGREVPPALDFAVR